MGQDVFRFGIVGAGGISEFQVQAIAAIKDAELVAVYTRTPDRAADFANRHGCVAYDSMDDFLTHPGLDIVTICTPSGAHLEPALAAAKAGKHVIVEKPIEVTIEKVDAMIQACEKHGVMLCGVLPRRFTEATSLLKQAVDQGRFGTIALAEASIKWWRTQEYYDSSPWRGTWALDGGGALMNQSIHTIDLLLYMMGPVKRVCAFASSHAHDGIEVEDNAVAILEFANGARGVIQGSTACWSDVGHAAQVQISGTGGSAFMVDDRFSVWEFREAQPGDDDVRARLGLAAGAGGAGAADPGAIDFRWHQYNFEEALAALREGRKPVVDGAESRKAVEVIGAIYQSASQGGAPVELPLAAMPVIEHF